MKTFALGMSEKASSFLWIPRSSPLVLGWFKVLVTTVILGVLIVWGIDDFDVGSLQRNFVILKLDTSVKELPEEVKDLSSLNVTHVNPYLEISHQNMSGVLKDLNNTHQELAPDIAPVKSNFSGEAVHDFNLSSPLLLQELVLNSQGDQKLENHVGPRIVPWISAESEANYSTNLLARWLAPGGETYKDARTVDIRIQGLDGNESIVFSTGEAHEVSFQALDESGKLVCVGGDYFETDLSGEKWKSRPPVRDLGNGTYTFLLQVHPDFEGTYNLTVILLFRHFEGLKFSPVKFAFDKVLRVLPLRFRVSSVKLQGITQCQKSDFTRDVWSGRWTRHAKNDNCAISNDGRYRCQESNFPCQHPWCNGYLGMIESNGWVYSAHCSFKMFSSEEAWNCLSNRWIFWWGDSNHCDTIRNILNFILDVKSINTVPRIFDMNITNPRNPSLTFRFTSIFNGHWDATSNYQGLNSLINAGYRELLKRYFSQEVVPDTLIMNSGLHDGVYWPNLRRFVYGADYAAAFWAEVMEGIKKRQAKPPEVMYRSTIAAGGYARRLQFNPQKMEVFNGVLLDKLRKYNVVNLVIDDFDMTYPWHYDNRANDGVHYGRAPLKMRWRDGQVGHQYFVDLMLGHVLLNSLCAK